MKKVVLFFILSLMLAPFSQAQNIKEEEFVKKVFEALKTGDKKLLLEKLALQADELDLYNESQKALGSPKVATKEEFAKFIEDKIFRMSRNYDELMKNAALNKVDMKSTVFVSYKKIADPTAELPSGYYKIYCKLYDSYNIRINIELCPMGDGFKLFYLEERMNVTM